MVLDGLSNSLRKTLRKIANAQHIDKALIKEVVKEIQRALLQSDVNVRMVLDLTKKIEDRALEEKPPAGMSSKDHVVNIVYEELVKILGETKEVPLKRQIIMLVGLYGQGKTTTCGKLARYFQKRGLKTALIAGDVHRPAAYNQLQQIADKIKVPIYGDPKEKKAHKIIQRGLDEFEGYEIIIIDTSGRHGLEDDLIQEMKEIANVSKPDWRLLIMDATVGQQAGPQAKAFHDAIGVNGVIISKLDGTAKGGGALSAVQATKAPVVFIGTGEHIDDLEKFDPPRFISRMLGMGDIKALIEKAQGVINEDDAEATARKLMSGKFSLRDMYTQMEMMNKMGPLQKVMDLMPFGMAGKMNKEQMKVTQDKMAVYRVIMDSMTGEELDNPKIIRGTRINRIAKGCGRDPADIKELIKQYDRTRKAVKGFTSNRRMRKALMDQIKKSGVE